jgi:dTDP-4-dehydrorhamnose reductase
MAMENQNQPSRFEYWGGLECTLNRVGDRYYDQLEFSGHYQRSDDVRRIASLGISTLRYPVLWELHEPRENTAIDWSRSSKNLLLLRDHGITPVAGLLHHGSGPHFTSLEDSLFPEKLARYARRVAESFPWLTHYTPVNEPLTTARFSGLYGFWYPHQRNDFAFLKMLFNQVKGVVCSMREIRKVNPEAKLVQTEDLAKTYSGRMLKYQADFENERRWLTYDLLCGKVDQHHSLWNYLQWVGLTEGEILWFRDNPCVPDIAGFNHYVTSERFLDPKLDNYPDYLWGGNHQHRYVDTEAIRVRHGHSCGLQVLLEEAWSRFGLPIVITEAFLSCDSHDQVRWLMEMKQSSEAAASNGVDIRGFTFWALFGEFSWNKLVTSMDGDYNAGAFNVWGAEIHETLLADYIRCVTAGKTFEHECVSGEGWWQREDRYHPHELCLTK